VRIPVEFELPGTKAIMRREGDRPIIEAVRKRGLAELLNSWEPLDEEFPEIKDFPLEEMPGRSVNGDARHQLRCRWRAMRERKSCCGLAGSMPPGRNRAVTARSSGVTDQVERVLKSSFSDSQKGGSWLCGPPWRRAGGAGHTAPAGALNGINFGPRSPISGLRKV
jgi:antitoxin VapB